MHGARGLYREVGMGTFFYYRGQVVESYDRVLSEGEAMLRVAVLAFDLQCPLKDIVWSVADDFACIWD